MSAHKSALNNGRHYNIRMQRSWNKYKNFNFSILSTWETQDEAFKEEQRLLDLYFGKPGYMMLNEAANGAKKGRTSPMKGRKQTPEHIKKRADSHRGMTMTIEQRNSISKAHIKNKQPVLQYNKDGTLIREWNSIQDINFNLCNIVRCCRGIRKSAFNFIWKFK